MPVTDDGEDFFSSTPPPDSSAGSANRNPSQTNAKPNSLFRGDEDDEEEEEVKFVGSSASVDHSRPFVGSSKTQNGLEQSSETKTKPPSKRMYEMSAEEREEYLMNARYESLKREIQIEGRSKEQYYPYKEAEEEDNIRYGYWNKRYIGSFVVPAYSLSKGRNYIQQGDRVDIQRQKPKGPKQESQEAIEAQQLRQYMEANKKAKLNGGLKQSMLSFDRFKSSSSSNSGTKSKKTKEHTIVRFSNKKGFEVGRIASEVSVWMSKVMDNDAACFEGMVVDCPAVLTVGCDILLEIRAYILRSAFSSSPKSGQLSFGSRFTDDTPTSAWGAETAESEEEKKLRERKVSLIRLFRACTLNPSRSSQLMSKHRANEDLESEAMLENFPEVSQALKPKQGGSSPLPATGGSNSRSRSATPPDVDDGTELTDNQVDSVYNRAQMHDSTLPEVEPNADFALSLRPYQKQALGWMLKMEEKPRQSDSIDDDLEGRSSKSLHPLWEEYTFPLDEENMFLLGRATPAFYLNPYTGHLSLRFQAAGRGARGGILADEMGLGKTIQMASLILTNQPDPDQELSDGEDGIDGQDDDERQQYPQSRQISLAASFAAASKQKANLSPSERKKLFDLTGASRGRATLVVAPMSLVGQWRDEMERAIPTMKTMLYYGDTKGDLIIRLSGGSIDIVITSYGTLTSEYNKYRSASTSSNPETVLKVAPLYGVEWLRVILDEAHQIKNKATKNSRACRDLNARRRWCLTGTPIVNRLTDLYSLLRFLRVEPWGDFSFFNTFIAKPFLQKNPKALEIVQVILESILIRREKRMKDKDGNPIVDLPPKTIHLVRLAFTPLERQIYESVYNHAHMQYQTLAAAGTISRNFSFIFSVLMRLRQAVCHPLLVVKGGKSKKTIQNTTKPGEDDEEETGTSALGDTEDTLVQLVAAFQAGSDSNKTEDEKRLSVETLKELFNKREEEEEDSECPFCFEEKSELLVMPCKHWGCRSCIMDHMQRGEEKGDEEVICPTCRKGPVTMANTASVVRTRRNRIMEAIQSSQEAIKAKDEEDAPSSQPSMYFHQDAGIRSSTKLEALIGHLNQLRYDDPTFKGVIFSQFTSFLDLVEVVLRKNHHPFVRLDGTTSQKERESVLHQFSESPKRMLILVSLRAGGVGLNLVAANHVWLLDCWWNASTEDQAVDRIHRLGQTRPVHVHRYLIEESIEDRILAIQARKTALVGAALAGSRGLDEKSEALQNLELLFS